MSDINPSSWQVTDDQSSQWMNESSASSATIPSSPPKKTKKRIVIGLFIASLFIGGSFLTGSLTQPGDTLSRTDQTIEERIRSYIDQNVDGQVTVREMRRALQAFLTGVMNGDEAFNVDGEPGVNRADLLMFVQTVRYFITCGNGRLNSREQCDDANTMSGDGCSPLCVREVGYRCDATTSPTYCEANDEYVEGLVHESLAGTMTEMEALTLVMNARAAVGRTDAASLQFDVDTNGRVTDDDLQLLMTSLARIVQE